MKTNLTAMEKKLIEKISRKQKEGDFWLINHLYAEYERVFKRPFNG